LFQLISLMTTTGFGLADSTPWPLFLPVLLLATALIGGCAGSTSGGLKVVRTLLLSRQGLNELRKLVHPHGEFVVKLGGRAISPAIISAVWAFFAVYVFVFMVIFFLMMATGLDVVSAFGATIATLTSAGPGLGSVAGNFATVSTGTLWVGTVSMLLGRLEIFTVLVLFVPMFWRR
jgi:trk system potassium uptake protein TrkH